MTIGFVDDPAGDGTILVAAGAPSTAWSANLLADPRAEVRIGGRTFAAEAELLADGDRRRGVAVRELILRYGTPSEGLGSGPIFALHPIAAEG